jgi:bifunctional non-homologous end joining protein LigD
MSKQLKAYTAKRNFRNTAEPRGAGRIRKAEHSRFVVQKHDATRLHFDLRLEHNGVFKSWAVTKGPSFDPADKRLAVEVEDHPLDYGDFEGTIPKGEYGGGTVMLWDRGFWTLDGQDDVEAALKQGELKFVLAGERLKGSFVLVRMKNDRAGGKRTNWLLIKHKDEFAKSKTSKLSTGRDKSVASGRSMTQIAAGKGMSPKPFMTIQRSAADPSAVWHSNKANSSTTSRANARMPPFIEMQLCKTASRPPSGDDWVHEIKFDGYRMQLRIENGRATLRTRSGLDWTERFTAIARTGASLPDAILDGEVVALSQDGAPSFSALQAALSERRTDDLVYFAFDLLFERGEDLRTLSLDVRKQRLKQLLPTADQASPNLRYVEHLSGNSADILASARKLNLEGIVSKQLSSTYQSGRADAWKKSKGRNGHEVVIGGWSGNAKTLRSLIVGVYRGGDLIHTGRVGTGFNSRNSPSLLKRLATIATAQSPFAGTAAPPRQRDWTWVQPSLVAEIEFAGWTDAGMVRQAAFKGLREDKTPRDVVAEGSSISAQDPARMLKSKEVSNRPPSVSHVIAGVAISKPDKALWPASDGHSAVSKLDLAQFLEHVGSWMIEHLRGRPCSIIRAPDGIENEQFFQRHAMPGLSKLVALQKVSGDRRPYLRIDSVDALVSLAQLGAVEFHPWNCAPGMPDVPGRLIFDLDPAPDVEFSAVIDTAKELRARLELLGLSTFCKTTGGKGIHVVTPLRADADATWDDAKAFSQAICSNMANDSPDRYLVNMSKRRRTGRIFLDYLRNDRMATAVAPLSPRARPHATVSLPLNWSQVKKGLDPSSFTIRNAHRLLDQHKPWSNYSRSAISLKDAIRTFIAK